MKNTRINTVLSCLLAVLVSVNLIQAQPGDTKSELIEMGNALVNSLKNNDQFAFMQLHLTQKDLSELAGKQTNTAAEKERKLEVSEQQLEQLQEDYQSHFKQIVQTGIQNQINWSEVELSRVENTDNIQKEGDLLVAYNPVVHYVYRDQEHQITLGKVVKLSRGWVIVEESVAAR
jgi:hypothetical protein